MFTAIYAIMFAGMTAGNNSHFIPDAAACNNSAANIFQIQDSLDEDQMQDQEESKRLKEGIEGDIELNNITFKYNSRSETLFEGLSLTIQAGKKTAFVATSGCEELLRNGVLEPVLFLGSFSENIRHSIEGVSDEEIADAPNRPTPSPLS